MRLLFCNDPFNMGKPDALYEREVEAAQKAGLAYALLSFEALMSNVEMAIAGVPTLESEELAIFRGWMLKPEQYTALYNALLKKNWRLINSPEQYKHCHHLPESYPIIENETAYSVWLRTGRDVPILMVYDILQPLDGMPIIVKDFVKSQKHYWNEAFYIPDASDKTHVETVVKRFVELQGEDLAEGLVFREYVELERIGTHPKSEAPLVREYRIFWLDGKAIFHTPYWDEGSYTALIPPFEKFEAVAQKIQSRFFTMDIAKRKEGEWMIIELGDGQVAGLPERANADHFYKNLELHFYSVADST